MGTSLMFKLAIFEQQDKSFHKGYHIMWAQQTLRCRPLLLVLSATFQERHVFISKIIILNFREM